MENGGDLEGRVQNLEIRFARVEQILPTLATKDDLKGMPTVDDPKGFAMKADLERFATRDDFERFATKDDLERFATKADLQRFATKEDLERYATKEDLERFATKEDLDRFATKEDLARYPTTDDLDRRFEQEGREMRQFVLEHLRLLRSEMTADMRVLLEQQQQAIGAAIDMARAAQETATFAVEEVRKVGEKVDRSLTEATAAGVEARAAYALARASLDEVRALRGAGPWPGPDDR